MKNFKNLSITLWVLTVLSYAVITGKNLKEKNLLYGVNVVWGVSGGSGGADFKFKVPTLLKRMKEAGVTNTRMGISWCDIERTPGKYDWPETDRWVNLIYKNGYEIIACFCTTPEWASRVTEEEKKLFIDRGCANLIGVMAPKDEFLPDYAKFTQAVAKRYQGKIKYYEFWNEPDGMGMPFIIYNPEGKPIDIKWGGDPKVYTKLLKLVYTTFKKGYPKCLVAIGGLDNKNDAWFLKGIYKNGGKGYFDALCLHPYGGGGLNFEWVEKNKKVMDDYGDSKKKIWITEWGWATTEEEQANLIKQSFAEFKKRPYIQQASYHTLNDWRTDESNPNSIIKMGLLSYDLIPKLAFYAFKEIATGKPIKRK